MEGMPDLTGHGKVLAIRTPAHRSSGVRHAGVLPGSRQSYDTHMSPLAYPTLCCACNPSHKWLKPRSGGPLKNEHGAGRVREAADHLVDRLSYRSFKLQGRYEFPPFLGMFIEQMLYLV
jgi:hypothetical protein